MSFDKMKADELVRVAEAFGVELGETTKNTKGNYDAALIIAALSEEGVTYEEYTKFLPQEKKEVPPPVSEATVTVETTTKKVRVRPAAEDRTLLVKMERPNHRFDVAGKTFTKEHPFVLCSEDEAQHIFDTEHGFRTATPREAQEYYS